MAAVVSVVLPNHSDNADEELNRIRLALDSVYGSTASVACSSSSSSSSNFNNNSVNNGLLWHQQRQLANQYLTSFQNTPIAWVVCDRLLWEDGIPNQTTEGAMKQQQRHFFAAQTLLTKCRSDHDVRQLLQQQQQHEQQQHLSGISNQSPANPSPVLISLRDSLLQHLSRSMFSSSRGFNNNNNTALATRLAMCISALAVQMGWFSVIQDILSTAVSSSVHDDAAATAQQAQTILFLFRALPEECASDRLMLLDDNNRFVMRDHFISTSAAVFSFFLHHLPLARRTNGSNDDTTATNYQHYSQHRILQAWYAWIRYVPIRPHVIAESPLLPATVEILILSATSSSSAAGVATAAPPSLDIVEQAADVVVEILRMYPSHGPPDNQVLVQRMLQLLSQLPLQQVLAAANRNDDDDLDLDSDGNHMVRDFCRIVTEMGESYLYWILSAVVPSPSLTTPIQPSTTSAQERDAAFHLVDWVLMCSSSIADFDIAAITLHFWYRMVMDLEQTEPYEWRQDLIDELSTRLLQFVSVAALNLMKYPHDIFDIAEDQVEDIDRHRYYVSETVEDCCRLLGGEAVLLRIAELLQQQVMRQPSINSLDYNRVLTQEWQTLESCLSCLVSIHKFVSEDENQVLPFVFEHLVPGLVGAAAAIPQHQVTAQILPPLRFTICKVIGKFARWLATRSRSNHELMPPLMPFLAQGLFLPECAPAAAVAIKELCVESHPHSFAIGQPALELYEQVSSCQQQDTTNQQQQSTTTTTQRPLLEIRDELQLLEGVCLALSKYIHTDPINSNNGAMFLQRLCGPFGNRIASNLNSSNVTPRVVLPDIQRLAVVVQHLKVFVTLPSSLTTASSSSTAPAVGTTQSPSHPIVELMQSLWPLLENLVVRFPQDTNTAEEVCRLHKHAIRSCGPVVYGPLLGPLMRFLVEGYQRTHQSPFLYAASVCVSEFAGNTAAVTTNTNNYNHDIELYGMVENMSNITFSFLRNANDFNNHPDVMEEFFYLMERMMNHCSTKMLRTSPPTLLHSVVQAAVVCMNLDHHGAHKGTMTFLDTFISMLLADSGTAKSQQLQQQRSTLEQVLGQEGGGIFSNLIRALIGDLPSYSPKIPGILWKFKRLYGESGGNSVLAQWGSASLNTGGGTSTTASTSVLLMLSDHLKNDFMRAIVSTDILKDDFLVALRAFQNACNRHRQHLQQRTSEIDA